MKVGCKCGTLDLSQLDEITQKNYIYHFIEKSELCPFCGFKVTEEMKQ